MLRLSAPTEIVFYTSLALAVFSVVVRLMAGPADGYGLLIVGYLVLLLGVTVKAQWEKH